MPGVDLDHLDPKCFCLIYHKGEELCEAPTVQAALLFALTLSGSFTDISQVLQDNGRSWLGLLHDALGEDVIVIFSLPQQFSRKCFQVPFGRLASLFLKLATEAENAAFLLFPAAISQEGTGTRDSGVIESQVHAHHFFAGRNQRRWRRGKWRS